MGGGIGLKVIIVSVHVSFMSVYVGQDRLSGMPIYVGLHWYTLVYVAWRSLSGTWSSTKFKFVSVLTFSHCSKSDAVTTVKT